MDGRINTYDEVITTSERIITGCPEDPRLLVGAPIGMYHCPHCGCMQIAGLAHVHEFDCWLGLWSGG